MKVLQILGVRPHLVKFINITGKDIVVWTGQHYDKNLLAYPVEKNYEVSSTDSLGRMLYRTTDIVLKEKPDLIVVYGDTKSTLVGAIIAQQEGIKLAHIEAGARNNDPKRPEEKVRRMVDSIADYLFAVNEECAKNLFDERVLGKVIVVGDLHYDRYLQNRKHGGYIIATIHRAEHVDSRDSLKRILKLLDRKEKVFLPLHPRTKNRLEKFRLSVPKNVKIIDPLGYKEMLDLVKMAKLVITDSGGLQKEAMFAGTPVKVIGKSEWKLNEFGDGTAEKKIKEILLK